MCAAISFRTVNKTINLRNFGLRFVSNHEMTEWDPKLAGTSLLILFRASSIC